MILSTDSAQIHGRSRRYLPANHCRGLPGSPHARIMGAPLRLVQQLFIELDPTRRTRSCEHRWPDRSSALARTDRRKIQCIDEYVGTVSLHRHRKFHATQILGPAGSHLYFATVAGVVDQHGQTIREITQDPSGRHRPCSASARRHESAFIGAIRQYRTVAGDLRGPRVAQAAHLEQATGNAVPLYVPRPDAKSTWYWSYPAVR
jgi:hypothetical protein